MVTLQRQLAQTGLSEHCHMLLQVSMGQQRLTCSWLCCGDVLLPHLSVDDGHMHIRWSQTPGLRCCFVLSMFAASNHRLLPGPDCTHACVCCRRCMMSCCLKWRLVMWPLLLVWCGAPWRMQPPFGACAWPCLSRCLWGPTGDSSGSMQGLPSWLAGCLAGCVQLWACVVLVLADAAVWECVGVCGLLIAPHASACMHSSVC